tara:strand:+ start:354 stop:917 length:564 start_codon:yes stop_codon:yes gene_type:complete
MIGVGMRFYICLFCVLLVCAGSVNGNVNEAAKVMEEFEFESIDGGTINLGEFAGQPILITNTASNCGFTRQYDDLQELHDDFSGQGLVVLAIPSADFFQEFNDNGKVKEFCEVNFSLTIPMTTITNVKGQKAHPLYRWLASEHNFRPVWNFNKVLFNANGEFVASFGSFTSPNSTKVRSRIRELLQK